MNELTQLLERLQACELAYKKAKSSLDNSLELIIAKDNLKVARYEWLKECESHILEYVIKENSDVHEFSNV